ncbi:hypothetical protein ACFV8Z_22520 [Streptomyces sp. NPDC059837]|jgi:hypothetical protein|uniref:hypothetical protein n=1 Tax=unclassified Streptomyces TaxID=2593676 RepID=UPI0022536C41|nr:MULTISPECIES: hypothetical protein [unclassified Streptomyces]MCX4405608.1 hypothetical protein [Streptomyces sp. NBC_01764]MCX5189842.1 hypothetical protein [Streptomyces sp. NBC_00268]
MNEARDGWRDEYEGHPEYQAILARLENPWWKRPVTLATGGVVALAASFFIGVWVGSSGDDSGSSLPASWVQGQVDDDQSQDNQRQNDPPAGLTFAQKSQLLSKFCNTEAGGPYDVSEAAYLECVSSYYVTDQGQVLPK